MALTQVKTSVIADDAVGADQLASSAVVTASMVDNAVTTAKITDANVTTAKIADTGVTTAKIADDAVTDAKLANSINAAIAANTAKTSNATHTGDVTGSTSLTIANNAVTTAKIADDAVTQGKIPANAIGTAQLRAGEVTTAKIADQAVDLTKLPHGTSSNDGKFLRANNGADPTFETISTTPADGSITEAKLANGAVTQTKIGDGSIINAKVDNAAAIAGTKISPDFGSQNVETDGDVKTGSYIRTRVASGGHFYLRNNSTGANYSSHFQTCSGGENSNVQTHMHYYHGGYAELLHQGNSSLRTRSGGGVNFQNGSTRIGIFDPEGIKFGTDTSSANGLHDYEYGSWTPAYAPTGGNYGSVSYSVQTGQYVKIGRFVMCQFYLNWNINNTAGNFRISGLPYASNSYGAGAAMWNGYSFNSNRFYVLHTSNDSYIYAYGSENGQAWEVMGSDSNAAVIGTISYYTTS